MTTGRTGCPATARWRCPAPIPRPIPIPRLYPFHARGRVAMAHPAATPHRQRLCLLQRVPRRRRAAQDLASSLDGAPWAIRARCDSRPGGASCTGTAT
jgi:hypothetical protein